MSVKKSEKDLKKRLRQLERENEAIRTENYEYRQLVGNLNEIVYTLDHNAAITYISPNIQSLAGYESYEIIGRPFTDFVHLEDLADRIENFQKVFSGEDIVTEYRYIAKTGEYIWIRTHGTPIIRDGKFAGVQGMLVDISDIKEAEAALRRSENKFRELFDNSADAIFIHDLDGQMLEVNAHACKQTGYSREELLRMTPMDIVVPREIPEVPKRIESSGQFGQLVFETVHRRKDGIEYPVEVKTRKFEFDGTSAILGVARDITERKIRDGILKESEWQKNLILNSAMEKIIYLDADMRIIWSNRTAARIAGKSEEEMTGRYCYEIFQQQDRPCPNCMVDKLKETKVPQQGEKQDYNGRWWFQRAYPALSENGEVDAVVMFAQDITERKQAEAEKAALETQFQQSQKMESIGRLAGGVAHDLNNLLSPILGYGEMMLTSAEEGNVDKKQLDHIVEAGKRARAMVRQLLAFSRKQVLEFKPFDLNELLQNFEKLLRYTLREDITIKINRADQLPPVNGDAGQIEQVIMNLAVNAQDAMPHGGEMSIATAAVDLDEAYATQRKGVTPGSYVLLTLSDTGEGLKPEMTGKVFEPFYTTKDKSKGTGLGLSTAYGIVKQHNGNIWAYSEPGLGTTFKVYLPVSPEQVVQTVDHVNKKEAALKPSRTSTVLVAEDEEVVRELIISMLESQGYTVLAGGSGSEVISILNQHQGRIDLLITDVIMPDMNGRDLHEQVALAFPELKTIFMSGYTEDVINYHSILETDVNFIQKPFTVSDLAAKIHEVLNQYIDEAGG